ncbi:MAG TPA: SusC/RagA family TonB-linked outer membrane protein [Gemmatimonadaceae bacterium]|nr:SusC/RagA family TonB-linked outer membrane protein [Gemmatimonadaceae bacterium]
MALSFRRMVAGIGIVALLPTVAAAQEAATVSGRVTGEGGAGLAGVSVSIPEMGLGALTHDDGSFTFGIPSARVSRQAVTITARRVGYKPKTARITITPGTINQNFVLEANPLQLGEVVVTGAGTATEVEKLGNVRNSVSAELVQKSNENNLVQALAAKAPNVQINQSAGDPGAASKIQIRGLRTMNGETQPLFVIDGIPANNSTVSTSNFNPIDEGSGGAGGQNNGGQGEGTSSPNRMMDINPSDIESVEILKGAAAAAIYGARAANGVILITTKHGRSGATHYELRSSGSKDEVTRKEPLQRSFGQGLFNKSPAGGCPTPTTSGSACLRSWGPAISGVPTYDHASEVFDNGHILDNVLSASGGNDRTTFYLSGSENHNEGVFVGPNNFYNRATVRLNASHHLTDDFTVGGNFSYADTRGHFTQRGNNVNGLLLDLFRTPPEFNNLPYLDPVSGLHRSYRLQAATPETAGQTRGFNNPFFTLYELLNDQKAGRSFGNLNAQYIANTWLTFAYTLGADYSNDERLEGCPAECSDVAATGRVIEGKVVDYQIDHNLTGTATWNLSQHFGGTVTAGQNLNSRNVRNLSVVGRTLIAPQPFSILNTLSRDPPSDYQTEIHNASYFGQATFDIYQQLYLTGALRNDGSTTFGRSNRTSNFPKASAAWTVNKFHAIPGLTFAKIRASYGEAGNEPQPYLTSVTFSGTGLVGGIAQGTGLTPTQSGLGGLFFTTTKPATSLKPERTRETEAGFDIGFWGEKADLSTTWYKSRTTDVILVTPIAPSTGFGSEAKNAGIFRNSGAELTLNLRPLTRTNYSWDVGLGWGRNQSLVESIAGADFLFTGSAFVGTVAKVGYPLGVIRSEGWVRCGITSEDVMPTPAVAACAGKPKGTLYIDDGNNGCAAAGMPCEDTDPRVLGDPNPKWTGNAHSSFKFHKLELSALVDVRHGGLMWNGTKGALWSYGTHADTRNRATCTGAANSACTGNEHAFGDPDWYPGPVTGPGAGQKIPIGENWYRNSGLAACPFTGIDEPCLENAGFVKLREISVGMTFDQPWVSRLLGLSTMNVRVAGRNLRTWTKYTGLDPETNVAGPFEQVGAADYFNLPLTRSFVVTIGLNR